MIEFLQTIHFHHPGWLWAWPVSIFGLGLLLRHQRLDALAKIPDLNGARRYRHPRLGLLRKIHTKQVISKVSRGVWRRGFPYALLLLCIHIALAQPFRLGQQLPTPPQYRDTLFLIDTSVSMILRDYFVEGKRTQRMTILKSVLTHFINQLKGNRIGLIAFSEQPYTLVPLTADYTLLKSRVRRLQPAVLTGRTTNLNSALLYTLQQLRETKTTDAQHKPALVLVTDVNRSHRDMDPRAIAAYLHSQGYRLYTIGIGASSDQAQEKDSMGLNYQPANFSLLEEIGKQGGGQFYWANNARSLREAIVAIQSSERRPVRVEPRHVALPLYQWPLLAGLALIMVLQLWASWSRQA